MMWSNQNVFCDKPQNVAKFLNNAEDQNDVNEKYYFYNVSIILFLYISISIIYDEKKIYPNLNLKNAENLWWKSGLDLLGR